MIDRVIQAINQVIGDAPKPQPLHAPSFNTACAEYVQDCVETGWVSSAGAYVTRLEEQLATYTGAKHAIAVGTGTAGLHIALLMAGVEPGDEVLCPSLTFVATPNAIHYCNATPHFVDVEATTFGVAPQAVAEYLETAAERRDGGCYNRTTGRRIRALVGMHAFGHPFDLAGAQALCREWHLAFVEDAAESLGSSQDGRHTGTFAKVGVVSFNGNKIVTTGGGGMILTDDPELGQWAKHVTTTAKLPHAWAYVHDEVGYNYRLPNLNAALGCAQIEVLDQTLKAKRALAMQYLAAFDGCAEADILAEPAGASSNYWLNTLVLDLGVADQRDALLAALHDTGYLVRPIWDPMHTLKMYRDCPRMPLPVTEDLARRVINLPSSADLGTRHLA